MKIDFSQPLLTLDGKPFEKEKGVTASLGDMCVTALLSENPQEPSSAEDKLKRWELSKILHNAAEIEVTAEEIVLIKKLAGKAFAPPLMGAIYDLIEPKTSEEK